MKDLRPLTDYERGRYFDRTIPEWGYFVLSGLLILVLAFGAVMMVGRL